MTAAHSAVRSPASVVAPRPSDTVAASTRLRGLATSLAIQAVSACTLMASALQLDRDLEGVPPERQRDLAHRWLDTIGR